MEQRKTKRFKLRLPLEVTCAGSEPVWQTGWTQDISSGGVLFTSPHRLEVGGPVDYTITLINEANGNVNLRCSGHVLRFERSLRGDPAESAFRVAASLERYEFLRPGTQPAD